MKKHNFIYILFFILFLCAAGGRAAADTLYLKNGRILKGIITKRDDKGVIIRLKIGEMTFALEQIDKIKEASPEENEEIGRRWKALKEARQAEIRKKREPAKARRKVSGPAKGKGAPAVKIEGRIGVDSTNIYVDGRPFYIKGVSYSINYPGCIGGMGGYYRIPADIFEKDFKMMSEAGINCIRSYEPLPPELLDLAEKYNIMVIENIVYPGDWTNYKSADELKSLIDEAVRIVQRDKSRPCILMWSIWNDAPFTWGQHGGNVVKRYGLETVSDFLKEIYLAVKVEDSEHLITGSNMMDHVGSELGFDFLDIIGLNAYIGGHGQWLGAAKARELIEAVSAIRDKHNKPVVILETGYSTYINEEQQYEVLKQQIEITNQHTAGIVIFQWSDGWWKAGQPSVHDDHIEEHWGLVTGYREPKSGYKAISETFNSIPTISKGYSSEE